MAFFTLSKTKVFEFIKKIFIHLNANKYFLKKKHLLMAFFTLSKTKLFELIKKMFYLPKCKQVLNNHNF